MQDDYSNNGFKNRKEYLEYLAGYYNVEYSVVKMMALSLGASEDFDCLVTELEDYVSEKERKNE